MGATVSGGDEPDGQYIAWLGQFQVAQLFDNDFELLLRADAQLADDKLLPIEKFGVGGALSVRGYRENQLVRGNGAVASAELPIPLGFESDQTWLSGWQFATFFDWGASWNKGNEDVGRTTISSAGLGLRWDPTRKLQAEIYWAHPFKNLHTEGQDSDLQDDGITFYLSYDFSSNSGRSSTMCVAPAIECIHSAVRPP